MRRLLELNRFGRRYFLRPDKMDAIIINKETSRVPKFNKIRYNTFSSMGTDVR
jgi:hypothetical protein